MRNEIIRMLSKYQNVTEERAAEIFDATHVARNLADPNSRLHHQDVSYVFQLVKTELEQEDDDNRPRNYFILPEFG